MIVLSLAAGIFLLSLLVRAIPYPTVVGEHGVVLIGFDAYYHMRRAMYTLHRFPSVLEFDWYMNHSEGAQAIWPPAFDFFLALCAYPFYDGVDPATAERIVIWVPPILGCLSILVLFVVLRREFGSPIALGSATILAVLPGHYWYSQLGFVDHHAAVSLMSVVMLAVGTALLRRLGDSLSTRRDRVLAALQCGVAAPIALLVWPGCLLEVGVILGSLTGFALTRRVRGDAAQCAAALFLVNVSAFLITTAAAQSWTLWGSFSPVVMSWFQPWFFGAQALLWACCLIVWRKLRSDRGRTARAAHVGIVGASLGIASLLVIDGIWLGVMDAVQWLGRGEAFQHSVVESRPLFGASGRLGTAVAEQYLSFFMYLFPIAWLVSAHRLWRGRATPGVGVFLAWSAFLALACCLQFRFVNSFAAPVAWAGAWSAVSAYRRIASRIVTVGKRRFIGVALVLVAVGLLASIRESYRLPLRNVREWMQGVPLSRSMLDVNKLAQIRTASWMRQRTPQTSGLWDAGLRPEYGVLARWYNGHIIEYEGQRPTVTNNFGDDIGVDGFRLARSYFAADEGEASAILERLGVRYVIAERPTERMVDRAMGIRLWRGGTGLRRHRLIYEFAMRRPNMPQRLPLFRVYEFVKGAHVVGEAAPGARVSARLPSKDDRANANLHVAHTTADADGHYELVLPYSTMEGASALEMAWFTAEQAGENTLRILTKDTSDATAMIVHPAEEYMIESGPTRIPLAVAESAVQEGVRLAGPSFR